MIFIGALVAVSAMLVWRRDGIDGVARKILTHDLWLFGEIMPRVLAGCLLGAFIAEILPHEKVSRSLGAIFRPEGPFDRNGVRRDPAWRSPFTASSGGGGAKLTVGADFGAHHRAWW